ADFDELTLGRIKLVLEPIMHAKLVQGPSSYRSKRSRIVQQRFNQCQLMRLRFLTIKTQYRWRKPQSIDIRIRILDLGVERVDEVGGLIYFLKIAFEIEPGNIGVMLFFRPDL